MRRDNVEIKKKVADVLIKVEPELIGYKGNNMIAEGIIDSFELIEIIQELEEEFDLEINADFIIQDNFSNIDTIVSLINKLLNG